MIRPDILLNGTLLAACSNIPVKINLGYSRISTYDNRTERRNRPAFAETISKLNLSVGQALTQPLRSAFDRQQHRLLEERRSKIPFGQKMAVHLK